jgi:peptidoglycan hydrolase-like protein with peptidoglycan-binding domain
MVTLRRVFLALAAVVALAATLLVSSPASAFPNAFFPTQSTGSRGADVLAIQHLLAHHGVAAPTDGVFAASTDSAVKSFQSANGLGADGIVGPATWGKLVPQLSAGAAGPAVRALQVELNAKRRLSLEVDGQFDAAVTDAVRDFQSHAGIGADGVAGPETWRNLTWHYDYPDLNAGFCDQDPDGNGDANWATAAAIAQLEAAAKSFTGHGKLPIGDAGFEHGGDIPGHGSHDMGMDIDIWPIRTDSAQCSAGRITWQSPEYDQAATRALAKAVRDAAPGHVKLIFFNDPDLIAEGLTTQFPNHDNHLHVRYCERVHPSSLYDC